MSDTTTAPAAADAATQAALERLNTVIDRLIAPDGFPWDSTQTPESLTEYVIEECHELVDAIRSGKTADMVEELGDVAFLILMIAVIPFTRYIVGTTIGNNATVVPLVIAAAPFVARLIESSLLEVDNGVVEAAQSMGASTWQIITKVLLPEAMPSLINGSAVAAITILGYSAMSGAVGGGGLGKLAIMYGYNRYQTDIMIATVILLIIIVQIFQSFGNWATRRSDKRGS